MIRFLSFVECVLAFDAAADFLGLTNGGYRALAQIFVSKKQNIEGTEQILVPSLKELVRRTEWIDMYHSKSDHY